jgi:hypothetical protein
VQVPSAPGRSSNDERSERDARCWGVADDGAVVETVCSQADSTLLAERWPPLGLKRADAAPGPADRTLIVGVDRDHSGQPVVLVDGETTPGGWERVESELAIFAAERLAGLIAVHAAVIGHRGRAVLVPGASGVGKSMLSVAAAAAGFKVLSDEYALIDPASGLVTGWRRPVRVRRHTGVDRLNLAVASDPVPVGLVAAVVYDSATGTNWEPLPAAATVVELMNNTVCAQSRPDESLDAALAIARSARGVGGTRGEADSAVVELLALLDSA